MLSRLPVLHASLVGSGAKKLAGNSQCHICWISNMQASNSALFSSTTGFVLGLQRQAPPEIFKVSLLGGLWSPKGKHAGESKAFPPQMQSQITPPVCRVEQRYLSISNSVESCVCFVSVDHSIGLDMLPNYALSLCL